MSNDMSNNGIINIDTPMAKQIGFTGDKFDGYLWKDGKRIIISFIESKQQGEGHLSQLFNNIEKAGFVVAVPTPLGKMQSILKYKGFKPHNEVDSMGDYCEVWEK